MFISMVSVSCLEILVNHVVGDSESEPESESELESAIPIPILSPKKVILPISIRFQKRSSWFRYGFDSKKSKICPCLSKTLVLNQKGNIFLFFRYCSIVVSKMTCNNYQLTVLFVNGLAS